MTQADIQTIRLTNGKTANGMYISYEITKCQISNSMNIISSYTTLYQ